VLPAGTKLGPYEIQSPIGAGGMGEVYRARDGRLDRDVAVKVLPAALLEDAAALGRFETEGKALAALSHPNLLAIFDVGREGAVAYLVTELLEGRTLRDRLGASRLPIAEATGIAAAIADGLAAAHARGIQHRDLKPENVFLTDDGGVKILDFGIARREKTRAAAGASSAETATAATGPEVVLGSSGYMSPEQVAGLPTDARSDIFALGAVLYEMLTGRRAFGGASKIEVLSAILKDEPGPMSAPGRPIPAALEAATRRCLAKAPAKRFDSARDLAFALRSAGPRAEAGAGSRRRGLALAAAVLVVGLAAALALRGRTGAGRVRSLAVLPFSNVGGDSETAYLGDGLTQSLVDRLSRVPGLSVASREAAAAAAGKAPDPARAGRDLGVAAVLTGSVQPGVDRLTVSVELVDAKAGRHLWGERYARKTSDFANLEPEIAREIVDSLKYRLTKADGARLANQFTLDAEAYQLYLKGRYYWNAWDLEQARTYFEKAIAKDPTYAVAYAGLSDTYAKLGHELLAPPAAAFPKARAAALEALKIDDGLVEARVALSGVAQCYDGKLDEAERELRAAIALQPTYALAHRRLALLLESRRRFDEAVAEIRRAGELEPFSALDRIIAASILTNAGRLDEALAAYREAVALDDGTSPGVLGGVLWRQGKHEEALAQYRKARELAPDDAEAIADLGFAEAATGRSGEAKEALAALEALSARRIVGRVCPAAVHAGLGENELALDDLEKAVAERQPIGSLNVDSRFDALRGTPRFQTILTKAGLP